MIQGGMDMISGMAEGMLSGAPGVITSSGEILNQAISFLMENLPLWLEQGVEFIGSLAEGVLQNMPEILSAIGSVLGQVIITIIQDFPKFLKKGFELIGKVASGLIQAIPTIVAAVPQVLGKISEWINDQDWLGMGIDLITTIGEGILNMGTEIWNAMKQVGDDAMEKFKNIDWGSLGKSIIDGIVAGLSAAGGAVTEWLKGMAKGALEKVKSFLGIASPSKVFRDQVGKWIPLGIAEGIENNADALYDALGDMSDLATNEAKEMVYRANNTYMPGDLSNDKVLSRLDAMVSLMAEYYPDMAESANGKSLINGMNRALGMAVI
jgi:phage-related protein